MFEDRYHPAVKKDLRRIDAVARKDIKADLSFQDWKGGLPDCISAKGMAKLKNLTASLSSTIGWTQQ